MHYDFHEIEKAFDEEISVLEKIGDPKIKSTSKSYRDGFDVVKENVKSKDIEAALESEKPKDVVDVIDWDVFEASIADENLALAAGQSGERYAKFIEPINESDFKFKVGTAAIIAYLLLIKKKRSDLVKKSGKEGTAIASSQIFDLGINIKEGSSIIRNSIGMNAAQIQAYFNLRKNLIKSEMKPSLIKSTLQQYQKKSILRRSLTIAQTEMTDVINEAHIQMFDQAIKSGIVLKNEWEEVWESTLDGRTSRICTDLDQQAVEVGGLFKDPKGLVGPFRGPSAHPNCRSVIIFRRRKK